MPKSKRAAPGRAKSRPSTGRTRAVPSAPARPEAPAVPRGFRAPTAKQIHQLKKLTTQQLDEAPAAIAELGAADGYGDDFGKRAPDRDTLVAQLVQTVSWSAEVARAESWAHYARAQSEVWNDAVARTLERLKAPFTAAVDDEPALARRYTSTRALLSARSVIAERGNATKRAKKLAVKKGT